MAISRHRLPPEYKGLNEVQVTVNKLYLGTVGGFQSIHLPGMSCSKDHIENTLHYK